MGEATRGRRIAATIAIAAVAAVAGIVGAHRAGAQELDQRVEYRVGDTVIDGPAVRNPSCSVSRGFTNRSTAPMWVQARMEWDGQDGAPVYPRPGDSAYTGPVWLQPGERIFAVWTNHEFIPNSEVRLLFTGALTEGGIGANNVEFIPACQPASEPPDTVPSTSTPDTVPATSTPTDPPPSTSVAPGPVEPTPPSVPGAEATTTTLCTADCGDAGVATGVLTSSQQRTALPTTGASSALATAALGVGLVALGWLALRPLRRKVDADRKAVQS